MFTAKLSVAMNASKLVDDLPRQNSTNGGSKETELKEFAVMPCGLPSTTVVMMVTPVAKVPITSRKWRWSIAMAVSPINAPRRSSDGIATDPRHGFALGSRTTLKYLGIYLRSHRAFQLVPKRHLARDEFSDRQRLFDLKKIALYQYDIA